ncbi:TylF/MycF/NovP-related O-methyltransferase [Okeania sp. SIO2B3]|uniref:TylF/MycF/NovP-related O-methyltransferase n=1 Tax=Okeania sp. SIO2B3 TaxID=2607784 RepID=UPI0025DE5A27|nr:class I SAM-dependent methyltransferase [Okeania sp. SIO2B3]
MGILNNLRISLRGIQNLLSKIKSLLIAKITGKGAQNIWVNLYRKAALETADYVEKNMLTVPYFQTRNQLLKLSLSKVKVNGLFLEFGCGWQAKSINFIANHIDKTVHGFDSFEGLPEPWFGNLGKQSFSAGGKLPNVRNNVQVHAGWFDQTLPEFTATHGDVVAFLHIDCDIYSSTKTIFDCLKDRIVPGTVIQFDEYFNYPGWKNHEYKAFQELVIEKGLKYEYLGYCESSFTVAVIIR